MNKYFGSIKKKLTEERGEIVEEFGRFMILLCMALEALDVMMASRNFDNICFIREVFELMPYANHITRSLNEILIASNMIKTEEVVNVAAYNFFFNIKHAFVIESSKILYKNRFRNLLIALDIDIEEFISMSL